MPLSQACQEGGGNNKAATPGCYYLFNVTWDRLGFRQGSYHIHQVVWNQVVKFQSSRASLIPLGSCKSWVQRLTSGSCLLAVAFSHWCNEPGVTAVYLWNPSFLVHIDTLTWHLDSALAPQLYLLLSLCSPQIPHKSLPQTSSAQTLLPKCL